MEAGAEAEVDIQAKINHLKEVIRKTPAELLQERVYVCIANSCIVLTSYKREKGAKGWSSKVNTQSGKPLFNKEEQVVIEEGFSKAPWLLELLNEELNKKRENTQGKLLQVGGSGSWMPSLKTMGSYLVQESDKPPLTKEDIGLDAMLESFTKKIDSIDDFWDKVAYESPGFLKAMNDHQDINIMGHRIPIKPIINLLMIILDSILLSVSLTPLKTHRFTKILNFVVFLEEMLTGQWRQMIFTSIGFFTPSGIAIGVIAKYIVNAWMFISPDLRTQLFKDVLKGGKSALLGFLLWASVTLPADAVRASTQESLDKIRSTIETLDEKMEELQEQGSAALAPYGKKLDFRGLDLTNLRKISFQDIQNLQSLAQWDLLVCSKEFQEIMLGLEGNVIFRFIIELLNIPTMDDDKYKMCKTLDFRPMKELVETSLTPEVLDAIPAAPKNPFENYTGEDSLGELKIEEEEAKAEAKAEPKAEKGESKTTEMGAEESKPEQEDSIKVNEEVSVKEEDPVKEEVDIKEEVDVKEENNKEEEEEERKLQEKILQEEELQREKLREEEEQKRKLHEEELQREKLHQDKIHQEEEQKRKVHTQDENPQNGGKRILKLKKSTRFRKATPRRTTRRL